MVKLIKFAAVIALAYVVYINFIQADWYPVGSADDGFTVEFPGKPRSKTERQNLDGLGLTTITSYNYQEGNTGFAVLVLTNRKIRGGKLSEEQITDAALDRLGKTISGRLVDTTTGTHEGLPYTELEYRLDKYSATMYAQVFSTNGKVLLFMASSTTMGRMTSGRGRFFKSVRFPVA